MKDPRCWREVFIRGGLTAIIMAVATLLLGADPWVWVIPPAVVALTILKWAVRPPDEEDDANDAEGVGDLF